MTSFFFFFHSFFSCLICSINIQPGFTEYMQETIRAHVEVDFKVSKSNFFLKPHSEKPKCALVKSHASIFVFLAFLSSALKQLLAKATLSHSHTETFHLDCHIPLPHPTNFPLESDFLSLKSRMKRNL